MSEYFNLIIPQLPARFNIFLLLLDSLPRLCYNSGEVIALNKLEQLMDKLHFAYRQKDGFFRIGKLWKTVTLRTLPAALVITAQLLCGAIFDAPYPVYGQKLDLTGYNEVFCDNFDGDTLDTDAWQYRASGARRNGFNAPSQVQLKDGNLILTGEYRDDQAGEYGAGWYAGMISLRQRYLRGYFEIRCKINKGTGFWSAFWIQASNPYNHEISRGGIGGAEIDIFESFSYDAILPRNRNAVTQTIHCNGWDDDPEHIDSRMLGSFLGKDIYDSYNTYGVEWTEDEYIFYINGVESARSSFGNGTSEVAEEVIVSLEIPDEFPQNITQDFTTQYVVDYVKIYQK